MKAFLFRPAHLVGFCLLATVQTSPAQTMNVADRIASAEDRAAAYKAQNDNLKETVASQSAAPRRLDQQVIDLQTQLLQLQQDSSGLQQALANSEAELLEARNRQASCAAETARLNQELTRQQAQARQDMADAQQAREALQSTLDEQSDASARLASCQAESEQMSATLKQVNAQLMSYAEDAREREQKDQSHQDGMAAMHAKHQEHMARMQQKHQQEMATMQAEYQQQLSALQQQTADNAGQNARLQAQLAHVAERSQTLQAAVSACESRALPASPGPRSDNPEVAALQEALARANAEIRDANQRLNKELTVERTLHARAEAEMENSYRARIKDLETRLKNCR